MYRWLVFVHVLAIFTFLTAHGASASVVFKLRGERELQRICVLLELSRKAGGVANAALLILLAAGIALGFLGGWWSHYWIWASLAVLILITVGMLAFGSGPLVRIRQLVDPKDAPRGREPLTPPPGLPTEQQLAASLAATRPVLVTATAGLGLALILWLMLFKPF